MKNIFKADSTRSWIIGAMIMCAVNLGIMIANAYRGKSEADPAMIMGQLFVMAFLVRALQKEKNRS